MWKDNAGAAVHPGTVWKTSNSMSYSECPPETHFGASGRRTSQIRARQVLLLEFSLEFTEFSIRRSYFVACLRLNLIVQYFYFFRCDGGKTHRLSNTSRKPDQHNFANDLLHNRSVSSHIAGRRWFPRWSHSPNH